MQRLINIGVCVTICIIAVGLGLVVATTFGTGGPAQTGYATPTPTRPSQSVAQAGTPSAPTARPTATATTVTTPSASPEPTAPSAEPTTAPAASPEPTAVLPESTDAPTAAYVEYTIRKGDILYKIAKEYNVTVDEILAINQIANPASLTVGQVIRIPRK